MNKTIIKHARFNFMSENHMIFYKESYIDFTYVIVNIFENSFLGISNDIDRSLIEDSRIFLAETKTGF